MADLSITITNAIQSFGPAPATYWGSGGTYPMTWGSSLWGEGTQDLMADVEKALAESISLADAIYKDALKFWSDTITPTSETTSEGLSDGSGWNYVFISQTTEAESRATGTYTEGSTTAASYTSASPNITNWS